MAELTELELLELSEFIIDSEKEKEAYFERVNRQKIFVNIAIYDSNKTINYVKFTSYLFMDENQNFKVEFIGGGFNDRKFNNSIIIGSFILDGVKIIFESSIESWDKNSKSIELTILTPKRMIRFQRRNAFRMPVPARCDIKLDFYNEKVNFKNLRVVNISLTGAAIHINTDEIFFEENTSFKNAKLHLNFNKKQQHFNVGVVICHKKEVKEPPKGKEKGKWFEVGLKFENINPKMEQEISLLVNEIARRI
jgi:c-di-GMP-binding flagellar brake protein YcgR